MRGHGLKQTSKLNYQRGITEAAKAEMSTRCGKRGRFEGEPMLLNELRPYEPEAGDAHVVKGTSFMPFSSIR